MGWRRLRRGANGAGPGAGVQGAAASPSLPVTGAAPSTPSGAASSVSVRGKLRAARVSAAARRLRVSFAMGQVGWALFVMGMTPSVMLSTGLPIEAAVGAELWWAVLIVPGACLLGLALFPTDASAIRVVCATAVVIKTGLGAFIIVVLVLAGGTHAALGVPLVALLYVTAAALAPTLRCRGDRAMQPRPALRRLWIEIRLFFLVFGVLFALWSIVVDGNAAPVSAASLLCTALLTSRNRGRLHRRLGRLGGRGTEAEEAEEAAAIAALVGGSAPDAAFERAAKLLRCLPASRLLAADLAASGLGVSTSATELAAKTEPARMGEVTAFLSHSWSDDEEAPGAKHALVSRWARRRQETTGKEPTLWLVRHSLPHTLTTCTR